jgi:hypothetical protein
MLKNRLASKRLFLGWQNGIDNLVTKLLRHDEGYIARAIYQIIVELEIPKS